MPTIHLTNFIAAPVERVFDLSRSVDLHKKSLSHTNEEAIAGTITGLINCNETVTWRAKHFGKMRIFKSKITSMQSPVSFTDEMMEGDFKLLKHEHHFKSTDNGTLMIDLLYFEAPYGAIGKLANRIFLTRYLKNMLERRNHIIKEYAESDKWKLVLNK